MKRFRYFLGISFLLSAFAVSPVMAVTSAGGSGKDTAGTKPTGTPASEPATVKPPTGAPSTSSEGDPSDHGKIIGVPSTDPAQMKKRLEGLKAEIKEILDEL